MQPKSYLTFKWALYALATLLLASLQYIVLNRVVVLQTTPFIYPILAALVPMYEGGRQGPVFSLVLGLLCDLLLPTPFPGFYGIAFTLVALISAAIGEGLLSLGFFSGVLVSGLGVLLTGGLRILAYMLSGGEYGSLMCQMALYEALLSFPAVIVAQPVYRAVHRRCAVDY